MTTFYSDEIDSSANTERPTTAVVHRYSSSGVTCVASMAGAVSFGKTANTGALTAGVLSAALINISGTAGTLSSFYITTNDATARTMRVEVVADGVTVFDSTCASVSASGSGFWVVANGYITSTLTLFTDPINFNSTLTVKVASSLTETDKTAISYSYSTRA
jgi:hypothetical protein